MDIFETFLLEHRKDAFYQDLTTVIKLVLEKFFENCQKNPLLPLEIIFQFQNRQQIDFILSNYSKKFSNEAENDLNEDEDMDWIDGPKEKSWNEDEDIRLLDLFKIYSLDMETCVGKLSQAFSRTEGDILKRLKKLKAIGKDEIKWKEQEDAIEEDKE